MLSTPAKESLNDTRQLLDELDALMDQMLALPIDGEDDAAAASDTTPTVSATLTMLAPSAEVAPHPEEESAPPPALAIAPVTIVSDVGAPPMCELAPMPAAVPTDRWHPGQIGYQFLLWANQGYDYGTTWLGAPGRFLRSQAGKALLGAGGLFLLGAALCWLCKDWLGWNW
jgi:hypothetical protein